MLASESTERRLIEQFLECLRALPDAHADAGRRNSFGSAPDRGIDVEIDLLVGGKSFTLLVEAKKVVFPRDARQALWQIRHSVRGSSAGSDVSIVPVLVAESISPGARDLLQAERVAYYDSGGSLYLPAQGAYIYIDRPPPKMFSSAVRPLFTGRRSQVLHTLLMRRADWFGVKELAEQAMVSPATASQVFTELERFEWVETRGQGPGKERRLREPAGLLDAWAKQATASRSLPLRRYYVPLLKADKLMDRIGQAFDAHGVSYAITHEAAAQRYAPFLSSISQVRCRVLVVPAANDAIAELDARGVSEGANLALIEAKSSGELQFSQRVGGTWLASPIQAYLDLLRGEGRSREMAEHLRKERIGF